MKIYTKSGDKGKTSIIGGQRMEKSSARVCAYGSIDEVNAWVGLLLSELDTTLFAKLKEQLIELQVLLFDIGTDLATPAGVKDMIVGQAEVAAVEKMIDFYQEQVPPVEKFVLPGGHVAASHCHIARTVIRRAEREMTALMLEDAEINVFAYKFINRLSDLFFVFARYINHVYHIEEPFYERAGKVFH
jgi:cob(I)alamin adenosyltransferase